ncbi:hypothetical protein T8T21_08590 [Limimaricola variabilis]|uniref:tellurite resistance TerB family protein n=1 Tax=Limimaricola variabilis TaxID=1492771 RepID=UPI002AC8B021|nr:hypothetical protein [Limimaricola variabilis]WPY93184.1 hypothetical protein T8T21_08590 [Limimaricola variabilis]
MQTILEWLEGRSPDIDTPPAFPDNLLNVHGLTSTDSADMHEVADEAVELEPVFAVIDYCDATGAKTRRRITMRSLSRGPNAPILRAICHERRALRAFRCDRIQCFVDEDGVVTECHGFFREIMGIDLGGLAPAVDPQALNLARRARDRLRPMLSVLVAAARSDGHLHPEELDAILRYAETEALRLEDEGEFDGPITLEVLDQLARLLVHMAPQRSSIENYYERTRDLSGAAEINFERALREVILADGQIAAGEVAFAEELITSFRERRRAHMEGVSSL